MSEKRRRIRRSQMQKSGYRCLFQIQSKLTYFCFLIVVWLISMGATTIEKYPLAPPNTDSPRTTLKSFIEMADKAHRLRISGERKTKVLKYYGNRAIRCLDLSTVAPFVLEDVGISSVLLLKGVLDLIEIPPLKKSRIEPQ